MELTVHVLQQHSLDHPLATSPASAWMTETDMASQHGGRDSLGDVNE